jgi:hypothetical protein
MSDTGTGLRRVTGGLFLTGAVAFIGRLDRRQGLPRRLIPLPELATILMHPLCGFEAWDQVWGLLVARARTGDAVGAVGVALPGFASSRGRDEARSRRCPVRVWGPTVVSVQDGRHGRDLAWNQQLART